MQTQTSISFSHVQKQFALQTDRTAKELIPSLLAGKSWAKTHVVFSDLSFTINNGETVGIVGKNGAGKSTILKLIAGVTYPNSGDVVVNGKVAPLIELGVGFHHELTGYENIFLNGAILGMGRKQIEAKVDSIIEFSGLNEYLHTPIKRYSTGMYMRLAFAIAIHTDADILLIDEVLAVGDIEFQEKCLAYLNDLKKKQEKTIIFVSHDEKAVRDFCDRALYIAEGELLFDGKPAEAFRMYNS
jgi:lipopolysaccharide transport system ATP-binding protein